MICLKRLTFCNSDGEGGEDDLIFICFIKPPRHRVGCICSIAQSGRLGNGGLSALSATQMY